MADDALDQDGESGVRAPSTRKPCDYLKGSRHFLDSDAYWNCRTISDLIESQVSEARRRATSELTEEELHDRGLRAARRHLLDVAYQYAFLTTIEQKWRLKNHGAVTGTLQDKFGFRKNRASGLVTGNTVMDAGDIALVIVGLGAEFKGGVPNQKLFLKVVEAMDKMIEQALSDEGCPEPKQRLTHLPDSTKLVTVDTIGKAMQPTAVTSADLDAEGPGLWEDRLHHRLAPGLLEAARRCWLEYWYASGRSPEEDVGNDEDWDVAVQDSRGATPHAWGGIYDVGGSVRVAVRPSWVRDVLDQNLSIIDGRFVAEIADRNEAGRPTQVLALRALPVYDWAGTPIWEFRLSPAHIDYQPNAMLRWEVEDPVQAAEQAEQPRK